MATTLNRLSPRQVATLSKPGMHADGGGLYLVLGPGASRRWTFIFKWEGKRKEMGLGSVAAVPLAEARKKAEAARQAVADGRNPIDERKAAEAGKAAATTFGPFAEELVAELVKGFRSAKHRQQWTSSLKTHAATLWAKRLDEIGTDDVLMALKPIWTTKAETASRVRGRIERVLDAAKAKGLRSGENPARWRGHLSTLLSKRNKLTRGHHAAMAYAEVPAFIVELRRRRALSALALEFIILTVARAGEALSLRWSTGEIDKKAKVWTVPADRMKGYRVHRVPLTDRAIEIIETMEQVRRSEFVFPGQKPNSPLTLSAIDNLMLRMKRDDVTTHGFRSSFRDWVGETTSFPRELAEMALAHSVGDETEQAYRRGDALAKRRKLMEAWAGYIDQGQKGGKVVALASRRA